MYKNIMMPEMTIKKIVAKNHLESLFFRFFARAMAMKSITNLTESLFLSEFSAEFVSVF